MVAMLRDCIYGQAVGDALGVPYEFMPRDTFKCVGMAGYGTHNQPPGTWSDDTSMALALCDSYRELGRVDCDDILRRFRAWINDGAYTADGVAFDYGNATRKALATGRGGAGEWDKGNGSLMRCLPMVFMDCGVVSAVMVGSAAGRAICWVGWLGCGAAAGCGAGDGAYWNCCVGAACGATGCVACA